jgi:8-oxo-dGTP pyrophosphatase MutT (NUDIX family)
VLVVIVNAAEQILLLSHPHRTGQWEVVNGALNREETILDGVLRETREEIGIAARVRPLGTVHTYTFRYDDNVQYVISVCYVCAYEGGAIQPSDDMAGSAFRWFSLDELMRDDVNLIVPTQKWMMARALELYRLWKNQAIELQPALATMGKNKYGG